MVKRRRPNPNNDLDRDDEMLAAGKSLEYIYYHSPNPMYLLDSVSYADFLDSVRSIFNKEGERSVVDIVRDLDMGPHNLMFTKWELERALRRLLLNKEIEWAIGENSRLYPTGEGDRVSCDNFPGVIFKRKTRS